MHCICSFNLLNVLIRNALQKINMEEISFLNQVPKRIDSYMFAQYSTFLQHCTYLKVVQPPFTRLCIDVTEGRLR